MDEIINIFKFVVSEVDRIDALMKTDPKSVLGNIGLLGMIAKIEEDGFKGKMYHCGRKAWTQLYDLARERIKNDSTLRDRCKTETFLRCLENQIVRRLVEEREVATKEVAREILKKSKANTLERLENRAYLFPVYAIGLRTKTYFSLGSVKFTKPHIYFKKKEKLLKKSIQSFIDNRRKRIDQLAKQGPFDVTNDTEAEKNIERLFSSARDHYSEFPWIAEVKIENMEQDIAWKKGNEILNQTLNLLRLYISSSDSHFIGLCNESHLYEKSGSFSIDNSGKLRPSISHRNVEPTVKEEFLKFFKKPTRDLKGIMLVIKNFQNQQPLSVLDKRLLSALFWYGEAWKEDDPLPKIVKYTISLECLVMTGEREGMTELLAERISLICEKNLEERMNLFKLIKEIYSARSSAVHGAMDYNEKDLSSLNMDAQIVTHNAILKCGSLFQTFASAKDPIQDLKKYFQISKLSSKS